MWIRIGKKDIYPPENGRRIECPISTKLTFDVFDATKEGLVMLTFDDKNEPVAALFEDGFVSRISIPLPPMLREWMLAHDRGEDVKPIKFWLPVYGEETL